MNAMLKVLIGFLSVALILGFGFSLYVEEQAKENFCNQTYGEGYEYTDASDTPYNLEACVKVNANSSLDIKYIPKEQNE